MQTDLSRCTPAVLTSVALLRTTQCDAFRMSHLVVVLQVKVLVLGERNSDSDPGLGSSPGVCHCPGSLLPAHHHAGHPDDQLDSAGALSTI